MLDTENDQKMPNKKSTNSYLTCPRLKGQPKKHITVCHKCRYRKKCQPYRNHCQVQLPFSFASERKTQTRNSSKKDPTLKPRPNHLKMTKPEKMLLEIEQELRAIQELCK